MVYKRILVMHFTNGLSGREIAAATGDRKNYGERISETVPGMRRTFLSAAGGGYQRIHRRTAVHKVGKPTEEGLCRDIDPEEVCRALARKGETLKHLWKKYYTTGIVDGKRPLSYRQYCRHYQEWIGNRNMTIHISRYPRVNLDLDYAGKTLWLSDQYTPEKKTKVIVFVTTLSCSDYFYVEGMTCCDISNWLCANKQCTELFRQYLTDGYSRQLQGSGN